MARGGRIFPGTEPGPGLFPLPGRKPARGGHPELAFLSASPRSAHSRRSDPLNQAGRGGHLRQVSVGVKATGRNDTGKADAGYRAPASAAREVELIARIGAGDRKALEELYNLYHRRMARFLTRLTHRYDLAEEIINDTFWVVWRKAGEFRGESQPSTWIFGIAYRKARNAFRSVSRLAAQTSLEAS